MKTCWRWIRLGVLTMMAVWAQAQQSVGTPIRGEISWSSPFLGGLTVELRSNGSGLAERAEVRPDGTFEFRSASPGMCELRVIGPTGGTIHRELVNVSPHQILNIRLPDGPQASRSAGGPISIRQLDHKIPSQAQKAYNKGRKAAAKGKHQEAAGFFQQAVTIDPEFADARNELGAAEAAMGEYGKAAEQFQKAIDLDPEHSLALPNLCIVLAKMKRFREAGEAARRALKVSPGLGRVHYILAASLLAEQGDENEALDNLERAAHEVPKAHLVAADLLAQRGRRPDAAKHLEAYLRATPVHDAERSKVEAWLSQLQQ